MRGEKLSDLPGYTYDKGSPPHARGKGNAYRWMVGAQRITPACAGKRTLNNDRRILSRDHPRMRGEKIGATRRSTRTTGSPPHARGKALARSQVGAAYGITPACAGKRLLFTSL